MSLTDYLYFIISRFIMFQYESYTGTSTDHGEDLLLPCHDTKVTCTNEFMLT